jgi:hypothetical protein
MLVHGISIHAAKNAKVIASPRSFQSSGVSGSYDGYRAKAKVVTIATATTTTIRKDLCTGSSALIRTLHPWRNYVSRRLIRRP